MKRSYEPVPKSGPRPPAKRRPLPYVDEMTDADYDAQTEAAAVLLPLLEGAS